MEQEFINSNQNKKPQNSGASIASLILGVLSFVPMIGAALGIIAIVLGMIGISQVKKGMGGKNISVAGVILGVLGILFTITLYYSLYYMGFKAKTGPFAELKPQLSKQLLNTNVGSLEVYKQKNGVYPENLKEIADSGYSAALDDIYGLIYYKVSSDKQSYEIKSVGPDGELGTADDILPGPVSENQK